MKHLTPLALLLLSTSAVFALDGTYAANKSQAWSDTSGWTGNVVAQGSGYTATINRANWTATRNLTLTSNITIGSIVVEGLSSAARKFDVVTTNSSVLTFDGGGSAALFSNTGNGPAQIDVAVVLKSDLNLMNAPTDAFGNAGSNYMGFGYAISSDDNSVVRTITILPSALTPATANDFRVAISNDVAGNIAIRQNSGNNLNLQTVAKTFYGGLYIKSGNVNSSLGSAGIGADSNFVVFEARDNAADTVGTLNFTGNIEGASATALQSLELQSDGLVSVSFSGTNKTMTWAGQITGSGDLQKFGTGILLLSNANNTYTGNTIVSEGTLSLGVNNAIQAASGLVLGGGHFDANGFNQTFESLTLQQNATIDLGDTGTNALIFGDCASLDWGTHTLSIVGTFTDGFSVRFGTDGESLTAEHLSHITINGADAYLTATGYLTTAIPEPAVTTLALGALTLCLAIGTRRRQK